MLAKRAEIQSNTASGELPQRGTGMNGRPRLLERAFELARTGNCRTVDELRSELKREGFDNNTILSNIAGPSIRKQLAALIAARPDQPA